MHRSRGLAGHPVVDRTIALFGSLLIVSGILLGAVTPTAMASTAATSGWLAPGSTAAPNGWTDPGNALADDGAVATSPGNNDGQGFDDFAFSFPRGSIIDGFEVEVKASSTDDAGCQLTVALSDDNGANFGSSEPAQGLTTTAATLVFGGATDVMGDDGSDGSDWDPPTLEGSDFRLRVSAVDPGTACGGDAAIDSVRVRVHYRELNDYQVANPELSAELCEAADFNFIVDMSGSIGAQGSNPSNLPDLIAGINDFVDAFENQGGDGRYSGTRFNASSTASLTSGYTSAATFKAAISALSGPTGLTPTAAGITAGLANDDNDRSGVPNIMFVVTDGSPNNPPGSPLTSPATWLAAGDDAIGAADGARSAGYNVQAVYLSTAGDPGDTTLPFSGAGDAEWAASVMRRIGGGAYLNADFKDFAADLLNKLGCKPEVKIEKTADDGSVSAGAKVGFTVTLTNAGDPAEGLVVTDHLPAGIDWSEDPDSDDWEIVAHDGHQDLTWVGGNLGKGSSSVHVVGTTDAADCGKLDNTASFTTTNDGRGESTASIAVRCPDVSVEKTPDDGEVNATDDAEFSIVVRNAGPGTARDVELRDELPAGYDWTVGGPDGEACEVIDGVLVCQWESLAAEGSKTVTLTTETSADACSKIDNLAIVSASNEPSDKLGDNENDGAITVNCPDVAVTKQSDWTEVDAGGYVDFTVTIRNIGSGVAYDATASDPLPGEGWFFWPPEADGWKLDAEGTLLSFGPANLAPGESHSARITRIAAPAECGTLANTVTAFADNEGQRVLANNTASDSVEIDCPDVTVTKVADEGPFSAGDQIGFTIVLTNAGDGLARSATGFDDLPGDGWAIEGPANGWSIDASGDLVFGPEDVPAGESRSVHVVRETTFDDCGLVENSVSVSAGNEPAGVRGGSADASLTVSCPNLGITKTADHGDPVLVGGQVGFTIEIANTGVGDAFDVSATDELPSGMAWSIASQTGGWSIVDGVLSFGPATIAGKSTSSVHVVATSDAGDCGAQPNEVILSQSLGVDTPLGRLALPFGSGEIGRDDATENVRCPAIGIDKDTESEAVAVGQTVQFTLSVTVTDGPVTNAKVTDVLPAGLSYVDGSQSSSLPATFAQDGQKLSWTFLSLESGDPVVTITYQVTVDEGTGGQSIENPAEVCVDEVTECPGDVEVVKVDSRYRLDLEKSNDAPATGSQDLPTVAPGATIGYSLAYDLFVEGLETTSTIVDELPEGVTYVSGSASSDGLFSFGGYVADVVPDNGVSGTLTWIADPAATGEGKLTYEATADADAAELPQPLENIATMCLAAEDEGAEPLVCDKDTSIVYVNKPPLALTPPPTDSIGGRGPAGGLPLPSLLLLFGVITLALSVILPAPVAIRERRNR